jgi:hypothetical protein
MTLLNSLPETLSSLFIEKPETGQYYAYLYSATDTREVEQALAEHGISYRTRIIRSRKRGVYYHVTILEDADGPETYPSVPHHAAE